MRTIYILVLILAISCKSLHHTSKAEPDNVQIEKKENSKKSFAEFKGDTIQYLNSLVSNKQKYVGKTLNVLLSDLDLEVKKYHYNIPFRPNTHCTSIDLYFYDGDAVSGKIYNNTPFQYLNIQWAAPLPSTEEVTKLRQENQEDWGKNHQAFFGKLIVKDVTVYTASDPAKSAKH